MIGIWNQTFRIATLTDEAVAYGGHRTRAGGLRRKDAATTRFLGWIAERRRLARSRRALLTLNDHLLKDIGLQRADALREARRLMWGGWGSGIALTASRRDRAREFAANAEPKRPHHDPLAEFIGH